jgi:hypothetical protein
MSRKPFSVPMLYWPLLLSVLLICWTLLVSPHTRYGDNWALVPVPLVFLAVVATHIVLFMKRGRTAGLATYGVLHTIFVVALSFWSLTLISKDSL